MIEPIEIDLLKSLKVAAPCTVSWDSMEGDERVRHCSQCDKNVYNISDMTQSEANEFLRVTALKACVNFHRRADGTILTDNCPVGLRRLRAHYRRVAALAATFISLAQGFLLTALAGEPGKGKGAAPSCPPANGAPAQRTGGKPMAHPPTRGKILAVPMERGEAVATPVEIKPTPVQNDSSRPLGGAPMPQQEPDLPSVSTYKQAAKAALIAAMPQKSSLGNAAFALSIGTAGNITDIRMVSNSPSKALDKTILDAARKVKFSPLPKDYPQPKLQVYFECRTCMPQVPQAKN